MSDTLVFAVTIILLPFLLSQSYGRAAQAQGDLVAWMLKIGGSSQVNFLFL